MLKSEKVESERTTKHKSSCGKSFLRTYAAVPAAARCVIRVEMDCSDGEISFQHCLSSHRHYSPHNRVNCLTLIMGVSSFDSFC